VRASVPRRIAILLIVIRLLILKIEPCEDEEEDDDENDSPRPLAELVAAATHAGAATPSPPNQDVALFD
jgi:hypothetical protein